MPSTSRDSRRSFMRPRTRNLDAIRVLLAKGADANARSGDGSFQKVKAGSIALGHWTALTASVATATPELVKTLLDAGAEVNVPDVRGMTPLMLAVASDRQNIDVIRMLIARGADVQREEPGGGDGARLGRQGGFEAGDRRDSERGRNGDGARAGCGARRRAGRRPDSSRAQPRVAREGQRGGRCERRMRLLPLSQHRRHRRARRAREGSGRG